MIWRPSCCRVFDGRFPPGLPLEVEEESDIQQHADEGGGRGGEADACEVRVRLDAHVVRHRQADEQGLEETLEHDEERLAVAVEVAHHAEEDGGEERLRREAVEVREGVRDDGRIGRENSGEPSTREPDEQEHEATDAEANAYAGKHGFLRSFGFSRTDVLRHEGRHGLHEGARYEHREVDKLAGDAVAGGGLETETVDEGTECEEGELRQALLHRERDTDGQKLFTLRFENDYPR